MHSDEFRELTRRLYAVISTPSGQRDWESIRGLYHPRATMVRTGIDSDGKPFVLAMSFDEYVDNVTEKLDRIKFVESEISQDVVVFGNVARLTSIYEYAASSPQAKQRGRGVNFFNLVNEGSGWKVMSIAWDNERDGLSLADAGLLETKPDA